MLFVVAGPSGVGKSYLIQTLLGSHPDMFVSPPLVTTRPYREGKQEIDRISVTPEAFDTMSAAAAFTVVGTFQSNAYGFPATIVESQAKHVIINIWPALLPKFAELEDVRLVGLTVDNAQKDILRERMLARGDDPLTVSNRMEQVVIDLADVAKHSALIRESGELFNVGDQSTIPQEVVPWILQTAAQ